MSVRIWDIFLVEGRKTIFRFALAILKVNQNDLLSTDDMGEFYSVLGDYKENAEVEELVSVATKKFTFSHKEILKLENEYDQNPDKETISLIS